MNDGTSILPELRIAVANFRSGSTGTGDTGRWEQAMRWDKTVSALRGWQPHLVLCQEISAMMPGRQRGQLWMTANTLGMTAVPGLAGGTCPAVLVAASAGLAVLDAGPAWSPAAVTQPAWCEALVQVPGWAHPLRACSVDLPPHSSVEQRSQADLLASRVAGLGELAVAGGNWNSWGRAGAIPAIALDLAPPHLRPARMRYAPHDQTLTPNYDVHDVLASVGLEDAAALASGPGGSPGPGPAGTGSSGRADRLYLTWDLADAAAGYTWQDTGDSEHQALLFTLDGLRAARAIPPQPGQ